jgi:hypothetical protein
VVGWLADPTGKTSTGLYVVAGLEVLAAILILLCIPRRPVTVVLLPGTRSVKIFITSAVKYTAV